MASSKLGMDRVRELVDQLNDELLTKMQPDMGMVCRLAGALQYAVSPEALVMAEIVRDAEAWRDAGGGLRETKKEQVH